MPKLSVLTIDLGATSGRGIVATFDGKRLELEGVSRFSTLPVTDRGHSCVDFDLLLQNSQNCLAKAHADRHSLASVGVDSWGLDVGLLDENGKLLCNPIHYQDLMGVEGMEIAFDASSREELFEKTGSQPVHMKSLFMLLAIRDANPELLEKCGSIMNMSDLINYYICGEKRADRTIIGTTQLYSAVTRRWSGEIIQKFGIPQSVFSAETDAGTIIGRLNGEYGGIIAPKVTLTCGHDTASAFLAACVSPDNPEIVVSCGTRALVGTIVREPIVSKRVMELGLTNESGFGGSTRLLKSCVGLSLFEKLRRELFGSDEVNDFEAIDRMVEEGEPFQYIVDTEDVLFWGEDDVQTIIKNQLAGKHCRIPETPAQYLRCVLESSACSWANVIQGIKETLGVSSDCIHVIGGGSRNEFLMQLMADLTGMRVCAGPAEATAAGNALTQLYALGELQNRNEMHAVLRHSTKQREYTPTGNYRAMEAMAQYRMRIAETNH